MDFMLEEELIDLITPCLAESKPQDLEEKKKRITEIGNEIYQDGGADALENFFFSLENRIQGEIGKSPKEFRKLWNGIDDKWNY
ncbi:MAG: hypothetical protein R1F52_06100 [Candidatus Nitrosoabyssus spongiisocia]|nr:MAG: hypothetical protein R1F52_06100 [Nitrosopumilaceae archaeon AB1(1)]